MSALLAAGCNVVKKESKTAKLLETDNATQAQLMNEVNRFARVASMRAKMDLKFEDNSFAQFGSKEVYRSADGEVVVQRPANILLKVQAFTVDIARMTSDGNTFRVAILQDGGSGKYKKFVKGTNDADYSRLQKSLEAASNGDGEIKQNVNAFANLRPQHFTDAMLVRPIDNHHLYTRSTIYQIETDETTDKKSATRTVMRGYYLLDEYVKAASGEQIISRRFWFDRVGGVRLARQQLFDAAGEIDSDIMYGRVGNLTASPDYRNLPLRIVVTRPKEKYTMSLTYKTPAAVTIGKMYPATAFVLENTWELDEVDLDQELREVNAQRPAATNQNTATTRFQ